MNEKVKELIKQAGTDCSGKWISLDSANELIKLTVLKCCDIAHENFHVDGVKLGIMLKDHFDLKE